MPQVPFTSFYLGPTAVYTSKTGLLDVRTGLPQLGGNFAVGDYCDLSASDAAQWNRQYSTNLYPGRYRIVSVAAAATAANIIQGNVAGWALGTYLDSVTLSAAGSGYTNGTFTCSSSTSGGTTKATATVVVSGGAIISAQLLNPGAGFTSVPTFGLSELTGGTGGSVLANMHLSSNIVTSFDSSATDLDSVRGVFLGSVTSAQVTAGAYVIIQELGIATILVTTATATAKGSVATAVTASAITTTTGATAPVGGFIGYTKDLAAASTLVRVVLSLPTLQG
jgi:hypothetical protein